MFRAVRVGVVGALAACTLVAFSVPATATPAEEAAQHPYVTVLLGRAMWAQSDAGQVVVGQPTLADLAPMFAARGVKATGVVTPDRSAESVIQYINGNLYASWDQFAWLRDVYGWTFVSNGQTYSDVTLMDHDEQVAETCGSQAAFQQHGHLRSWGMYGPGVNRITDQIAADVVSECFAFTRRYSNTNVNNRSSVTTSPYYALVDDTSGGTCNLATCSGSSGITNRYMLPSTLIQRIQLAGPDQWVLLSTYKLLTGSKLSGNRRWDCKSSNPSAHWTTEVESYCLSDFLSVLDAIPTGALVVDPATVAEAWGRIPPSVAPAATVPAAPSAVAVVVNGTSVSVRFTAPADGGSPITSYTATCTSSNGGTTRGGTGAASPITVTGLTSAKTYTCKVKATNAVGVGPNSVASTSFIVPAVPGAPSGVAVIVNGTSVSVRFTAPANGGSPITSYTAWCTSSNGGTTRGAKRAASPISVTGLTSAKTYTCKVNATNAVGVGPNSTASASFVTGA